MSIRREITYNNRTLRLTEWANELNISVGCLWHRLNDSKSSLDEIFKKGDRRGKNQLGKNNSCWRGGLVKRICQNKECGKKFLIKPSDIKRGGGKYCSKKCGGKVHCGKNNIFFGANLCGKKNGFFGKHHTEKIKKKLSEAIIKRLKDGKYKSFYNKLETRVAKILKKQKIKYIWQYPLGRYLYDFYLPNTNKLIEVNGTFWHADPRKYDRNNLKYKIQQERIIRDKKKKKYALKNGYVFRVLWEIDINNNKILIN